MHPFHSPPPYFPKIHFNIIFSSTTRSSKRFLPLRFSNQNVICISHLPMHPSFHYTFRSNIKKHGHENTIRICGWKNYDAKNANFGIKNLNLDILMELKTESITEYIKYYQENWRSHVNRMDTGRFLKAILQYRPQRKKVNRTSNQEMERKPETIIGLKA